MDKAGNDHPSFRFESCPDYTFRNITADSVSYTMRNGVMSVWISWYDLVILRMTSWNQQFKMSISNSPTLVRQCRSNWTENRLWGQP